MSVAAVVFDPGSRPLHHRVIFLVTIVLIGALRQLHTQNPSAHACARSLGETFDASHVPNSRAVRKHSQHCPPSWTRSIARAGAELYLDRVYVG